MKNFFSHYREFVNSVSDSSTTCSIFRGHSNIGAYWKLTSSYRRLNEGRLYKDFLPVGYQNLPIKNLLLNYDLPNKNLNQLNNIQLLQYLQHYGVPTPLIDFTFDYNVALYFAGSQVTYSTLRTNDELIEPYDPQLSRNNKDFLEQIRTKLNNQENLLQEEHKKLFKLRQDCYIDVIEIDISLLKDKVIDLSNSDISDSVCNSIYSRKGIEDDYFDFGIFTILKPKTEFNKNLKKQKGAFIYFDSNTDLDKYFKINRNLFPKSTIKHNLLLKQSLNNPFSHENDCTLYQYLKNNKCTGTDLFKGDYQGLRFDLNYISGT